ncbi:tRNA1(Val) (adenine(37)-N6)-methyltransferase [Dokdonia sinensis]|nr:methyltransferase [Dokdonia sinensis]
MKIGTDGVLLGAWTNLSDHPNSILDIGTGTGVIALMLAQHSDAQTIDGLELDDNAFEQAAGNFENSPWGDRLFCYHAHLYEFATEIDDEYDLIVCNPPFFDEQLSDDSKRLLRLRSQLDGASEEARENARFEDAMPFDLLVGAVAKLLAPGGQFNVILPYDREESFIALCDQVNLHPSRITRVRGTTSSAVKRSLMEFRFFDGENDLSVVDDKSGDFRESAIKISELIIEKSRHNYTEDYIALVKDFYLKM